MNPEYTLGFPLLDDQHQTLLGVANEALGALAGGLPDARVVQALKALEEYAAVHFRAEEGLMAAGSYDGYPAHKADHDELLDQLRMARQDLESGAIRSSHMLELFVRVWVLNHIQGQDRRLAEFLKSQPASPSGA